MSKQLDFYINLTIADASNRECNKTDFSSYTGYATYIKNQLNLGNTKSVLYFLNPIIDEIEEIYGFGGDEASRYVIQYFLQEKWKTYLKPARMARNHFGKFLAE